MSQQTKLVNLSLKTASNFVKLQTKLHAQQVNQHILEQTTLYATLLGENVYTALATNHAEERECLLRDSLGDLTRLEYWLKLLVETETVNEIESRPFFFDLQELKKLIEEMLSSNE